MRQFNATEGMAAQAAGLEKGASGGAMQRMAQRFAQGMSEVSGMPGLRPGAGTGSGAAGESESRSGKSKSGRPAGGWLQARPRRICALLLGGALALAIVAQPAFAVPTLKPGQGDVVVVASDDGSADPSRAPKQVNVHMGDDPATQANFTYTTVSESTTQVVINKAGDAEKTAIQGTAGVGQGGKQFHAIAVSDLEPDTVYEYAVGFGENTYSGKFKTALARGSKDSFKFAYLADTQVSNAANAKALGATLDEVNKIPDLDFVYIAGDVTDTATSESQWEQLFYNDGAFPNGGQDMFGNNLLMVTQGNHDNNVMNRHINAPAQMGNIVYSVDYGAATFIILNLETARSDATARASQKEYLENAVADAKARGQWTIVGFHKSLVTGASHIADSDVVEARRYWIPVFGELDVDFVLQGHDHVYSRGFVKGDGTRAYDEAYAPGSTAPDPQNAPLYMIGGHAGGLKWYSRISYTPAPGDPITAGYSFLDIDSANVADNFDGIGSDVKQEQVIVELEVTEAAVEINTYMFKYDTDSDAITTDKYLYDSFTVTRGSSPGPADPEDSELALASDANLVKKGGYFRMNASFAEPVESNAAELVFSYDTDVFEYRGFTPASGVTLLGRQDLPDGVKLTVMNPGYSLGAIGETLFSAKEDANLRNSESAFGLTVNYVARAADGAKSIKAASAGTSFTTSGGKHGDVNGDDAVTLIDLSDIIDMFGVTSADATWDACKFFDYNGNLQIDIRDIAEVAMAIQ
jgi:hypothetical protein